MRAEPAQPIIIRSESPQRSESLGMALGKLLQPGDCICLCGPLGAGKTLLSRGIGAGWGAEPPLTSPTYNLAHEHVRKRDETRLWHIDCYRLSGLAEASSLGLDDIFESDDIAIIEWPERIAEILPEERLRIDIELAEEPARALVIQARGARHCALLEAWRRAAQLET